MVRITRYPHRIRASVVAALVLATVTLAASGLPADAADTATSDGQDAAPVRGAIHGYVFDGERYRTIDVPGATRTEAWDITNRGDVIGLYANTDGRLHGFRLDKRGKYTKFDDPDGDLENDLTGGNDRGVTVGSLLRYDPTMGEAHGYLRDARGRVTTIDVPGALTTLAWRINNRGQVVGIYSDVDRQVPLRFLRGYLYQDGGSSGSTLPVCPPPSSTTSTTAASRPGRPLMRPTLRTPTTRSCGSATAPSPDCRMCRARRRPSTSGSTTEVRPLPPLRFSARTAPS
jgi:hypothetical protein